MNLSLTVAADFPTDGVAALARAVGGARPVAIDLALDSELKQLDACHRLSDALADEGLFVTGLSAPIVMSGRQRRDRVAASHVQTLLDLAASIDADFVRIFDATTPDLRRFVRWLTPLVEQAAQSAVRLLVQNAMVFRTASKLWRVLEGVNSESLRISWDPRSAAAAGEKPAQSLPLLGRHIELLLLRGPEMTQAAVDPAQPVPRLVHWLDRVGYDRALNLRVDNNEQSLADLTASMTNLRRWSSPAEDFPTDAPRDEAFCAPDSRELAVAVSADALTIEALADAERGSEITSDVVTAIEPRVASFDLSFMRERDTIATLTPALSREPVATPTALVELSWIELGCDGDETGSDAAQNGR